jgi:hypothetical protein
MSVRHLVTAVTAIISADLACAKEKPPEPRTKCRKGQIVSGGGRFTVRIVSCGPNFVFEGRGNADLVVILEQSRGAMDRDAR